MIVDDNEMIRKVIRATLEEEGYEVIEAERGQECLNFLWKRELPDLVLLDVMMPEMDGWEVARRIKSNEKLRDVIVCMLTAKDSTLDALMSIESAHANWHLNKPISKKNLISTVKWLLSNPPK
jgi:CheY-like chemotaxis protein